MAKSGNVIETFPSIDSPFKEIVYDKQEALHIYKKRAILQTVIKQVLYQRHVEGMEQCDDDKIYGKGNKQPYILSTLWIFT